MKTYTKDIENKTILKVASAAYDKLLLIFTDGTYTAIQSTLGYYGEIEEPQIAQSYDPFDCYLSSIELELISQEEAKEESQKRQKAAWETFEAKEKQEYQRLQQKFEKK